MKRTECVHGDRKVVISNSEEDTTANLDIKSNKQLRWRVPTSHSEPGNLKQEQCTPGFHHMARKACHVGYKHAGLHCTGYF